LNLILIITSTECFRRGAIAFIERNNTP